MPHEFADPTPAQLPEVAADLMIGGIMFAFAKFPLRIEPIGDKYFVIHGSGKPFRESFPECQLRPFSRVGR